MAAFTEAVHRLLTVDEFDRAWSAGVFGPQERLELIEGEVIRKLSPQESPHATATSLVAEALCAAFGVGCYVRTQLPLQLDAYSKPEPDVAVVRGQIRDYARVHPTTALMVVEVSDSTLTYDRDRKAELYAAAGIQEYWIVNLNDRILEVHRQPVEVGSGSSRFGYESITHYSESESVTPLGALDATIAVSDLLP